MREVITHANPSSGSFVFGSLENTPSGHSLSVVDFVLSDLVFELLYIDIDLFFG